ncbi:MAG: ATP-binding cassette domain-containing protein [Deltaproteobacteria bacterium]|nr:ATP-binding cassette domain-containing protein [Deltaproteobacteria bacterium]
MPLRTHVVVGTGPGADVVVTGAGVAPQHAHILQRDGALYIQDLGQGQTSVDGRVLAQGETAAISGFHANVTVGAAQVALTDPAIGQLFVERSPLPRNSHVCLIGRDPSRCHVIVAHPTVSGAHLTLDLAAGTITDTGSRSGTFDRSSRRLPVNIPEPLDVVAGYFVGSAWLATKLLLDVAAAPPAQGGASDAAAASNAHWQRPTEESRPQAPQGGPSGQFAMPTPQPQQPQASGPVGFGGAVVPPTGVQTPIQPPTPAPPAPGTPPAGGAPERAKHRTVFGSFDLSSLQGGGGKSVAVVGRSPEVDIVMPYPQLSSRHASIATTPDGSLLITDLGSLNGTYVQGQRIPRGVGIRVQAGERVFFGPYPTVVNIENGKITAYIESEQSEWSGNLVEIEALDLLLKVPDRDQRGRDKVLLNHVTFKCRPGDLIALMGPSGAGKTTLLTVLNGYVRPTSGEVRINGQNLYAVYDALRGNIGYVPQDDIVHPELTVWEAIEYSARFRLPPDFSDAEIKRRVEQTIKDLGLEGVKNLQIGKPERKVLSGGQRKRVNIALELVTDPALMFLDEPTSGLAADDTVALIDLLANLAKSTGKTIIVTIHQPAREEYEKFNLALIMGFGGEPVYFGPTGKESYDFFGRFSKTPEPVDNPRDMFDLLRVREDEFVKSGQYPNKSAARLAAAQAWRAEYYHQDNPTYRRMYSGQRQPGTPGNSPPPPPRRAPKIRQFALLLRRYATVKVRDRVGTAILLAQAPIIGLLLAMVYAGMPETPHYWCKATLERIEMSAIQTLGGPMNPNGAAIAQCQQRHAQATPPGRFNTVSDYSGAIFFLVVAAIWFGTSNAAREIVSEQAIYRRERMVNLSIMNYLLSKFVLLSIFCVIQCLILLVIVYPIVGLGGGDYSGFPLMLGILILTSMSAVAVGLLLSTIVTSGEAAVALTPIVLIPQVVLGGRLVPMTSKSWLEPIMAIIPARWSFEGVIAIERTLVSDSWLITSCLQSGQSIENGRFDCAIEEIRNAEEALGGLGFETYHQPAVVLMVLISITVIMLIAVAVILRRRDAV